MAVGQSTGLEGDNEEDHDEIAQYLNVRYLSSLECCWRIFAFPTHRHVPNIVRLAVHLPGEQNVYFSENAGAQEIPMLLNDAVQL